MGKPQAQEDMSETMPQVYFVKTQQDGASTRKEGRTSTPLLETEYSVLAASVAEAVAIISENITPEKEEIIAAWRVTHIASGLTGIKYKIVPVDPKL